MQKNKRSISKLAKLLILLCGINETSRVLGTTSCVRLFYFSSPLSLPLYYSLNTEYIQCGDSAGGRDQFSIFIQPALCLFSKIIKSGTGVFIVKIVIHEFPLTRDRIFVNVVEFLSYKFFRNSRPPAESPH